MHYRSTLLLLAGLLLVTSAFGQKPPKVAWQKINVLVYTKNGEGYVHDNIPHAVEALRKLSAKHGFAMEVSDNPEVFTEENLKSYNLIVFPSTNNDVFDNDAQRVAFRRYLQGGGGFVGLHSAIGTERNWGWFNMMVGGRFAWHPAFQLLKLRRLDTGHPSMAGMPSVWEKKDECYFMMELYPGVRVLMAHYLPALTLRDKDTEKFRELAGNFGDYYPAVWYHHFDGGNVWVTTLGHHKDDYRDPLFIQHIFQGMAWVAGESNKPDFRKAYATERDAPLR